MTFRSGLILRMTDVLSGSALITSLLTLCPINFTVQTLNLPFICSNKVERSNVSLILFFLGGAC